MVICQFDLLIEIGAKPPEGRLPMDQKGGSFPQFLSIWGNLLFLIIVKENKQAIFFTFSTQVKYNVSSLILKKPLDDQLNAIMTA